MPKKRWARPRLGAVLAGITGLAVAAVAGSSAAANYFAPKSPLIALRFDSANGLAAGRSVALLQAVAGERFRLQPRERQLLQHAIRRDPLSKAALRALGMSEYIVKHDDGARRYMTLAERVSRRDGPTQLWMISDRTAHRDLPGAISHFDTALSVSPSAATVLFPLLTKALAYPEVDAQLAPRIREGREWADGFLLYATTNVEKSSDLGRLLAAAAPLNALHQRDDVLHQTLERYIAQGDIRGGHAFAIRLMGASAGTLDSFAITPATSTTKYSPLTWQVPENGSVVAAFGKKAGLEVLSPPDTGGPLLTRTMVLPAGRYRLQHSVSYPEGGAPMRLRWQASCLHGSAADVFWSQAIPGRIGASRYSMDVMVPATCSGIRFDLNAQENETSDQSFARLDDFSLQKASPGG